MSIIGRTAFRASRQLRAAGPTSGTITEANAADQNRTKKQVLSKGARRDPELYVCTPTNLARRTSSGQAHQKRGRITTKHSYATKPRKQKTG